jgi:hypothetical protein
MREALIVVRKSVMDQAEQGLFHCKVRFEDMIPCDPQNQAYFLKALAKENLSGSIMEMDGGGVEVIINWSHLN